jgi:hypothetical protein
LFFWITKDDVGEARLTWQAREEGGPGYALLIGSDPARAPRKINRWGYISEIQDRGAVHVFGFMTQADEESLEQAKAATGSVPDDSQVYKVVHSTIAEDRATSAVQGLAFPKTVTLHDVDAVVAQLPTPLPGAGLQLPPRTEPGFLFAMSSLLRENAEAVHRAGTAARGGRVQREAVHGRYQVLSLLEATGHQGSRVP